MTASESRIHNALMQTMGNRKKAAPLCDLTPDSFLTLLARSEILRPLWIDIPIGSRPCDTPENIAINGPKKKVANIDKTGVMAGRPAIVPEVSERELAIADAVDADDSDFRERLDSLNIGQDRAEWIMNVTKLHARHSAKSIDFINGSTTVVAAKIIQQIEQVADFLETFNAIGDEGIAREKNAREHFCRCVENLNSLSKNSMDNILTKARVQEAMAKIQAMRRDPAGMVRAKPGFTPIEIKQTGKPDAIAPMVSEEYLEAAKAEMLNPTPEP